MIKNTLLLLVAGLWLSSNTLFAQTDGMLRTSVGVDDVQFANDPGTPEHDELYDELAFVEELGLVDEFVDFANWLDAKIADAQKTGVSIDDWKTRDLWIEYFNTLTDAQLAYIGRSVITIILFEAASDDYERSLAAKVSYRLAKMRDIQVAALTQIGFEIFIGVIEFDDDVPEHTDVTTM